MNYKNWNDYRNDYKNFVIDYIYNPLKKFLIDYLIFVTLLKENQTSFMADTFLTLAQYGLKN